jgi:hypothetical protein
VLAEALSDSSQSEEDEEEKRGEANAAVAEQNMWDTEYQLLLCTHSPLLTMTLHCRRIALLHSFFQLCCPHSFLELITDYTNEYTEQKYTERKENSDRWR